MQTHILVIDDEPGARRMIELMLKSKQYAATSAIDGKEGLNLLKRTPNAFQLILLDMMMPVMDGLEFMSLFANEEVIKDIPVVLQTGIQSIDEIDKALELGARCCIRKPFNRTELIRTIQLVLANNSPIPRIIHSTTFDTEPSSKGCE